MTNFLIISMAVMGGVAISICLVPLVMIVVEKILNRIDHTPERRLF
jgi:ABC-type phosphate transport system permease subunit